MHYRQKVKKWKLNLGYVKFAWEPLLMASSVVVRASLSSLDPFVCQFRHSCGRCGLIAALAFFSLEHHSKHGNRIPATSSCLSFVIKESVFHSHVFVEL
jgi:hypothetical protein